MPLYVVHCQKCEKDHEVLARMSESGNIKCPECNGDVQRIYSPCNFTKEDTPFFSKALGKQVEGNRDWIKNAKVRGWNTDMLDPY